MSYEGTFKGKALEGVFRDDDGFELPAVGTLSGSSLEIAIDNGSGYIVGKLRLHR